MSKHTDGNCPFRATGRRVEPSAPSQPPHTGPWPPGPPSGLTGWRLFRQISADMLGALSAWQQSYGTLFHVRMWPENVIVITDPEQARELLVANHDALIRWERGTRVFGEIQGHSVIVAEGQAWTNKRKALQPHFHPRALPALQPTIESATSAAFATWPQRASHWPIERALTTLTMDIMIRAMFSTDMGDEARQAQEAVRVAAAIADQEFFSPVIWPDWVPWKRAKKQAIGFLDRMIRGHIEYRLREPESAWPDDLLTSLLRLHREDPVIWSLQAVRDECMTTFLAGQETTAATLTWWAWCMASHPAIQQRVSAEVASVLQGKAPSVQDVPALQYLTCTLKETMRLYPAAPALMTRRAIQPVTVGSWTFPRRTLFMLPIMLMQHDSRWFENPQDFWPDRFAPEHPPAPRGANVPFGLGPRVCLGQHLATTEMAMITARLLQRWKLSVPVDTPPPRAIHHVTLRPAEPLQVCLEPA